MHVKKSLLVRFLKPYNPSTSYRSKITQKRTESFIYPFCLESFTLSQLSTLAPLYVYLQLYITLFITRDTELQKKSTEYGTCINISHKGIYFQLYVAEKRCFIRVILWFQLQRIVIYRSFAPWVMRIRPSGKEQIYSLSFTETGALSYIRSCNSVPGFYLYWHVSQAKRTIQSKFDDIVVLLSFLRAPLRNKS